MNSSDTIVDRLVRAGPPTLGRWINLFRGQSLSRRILLPTLPAVLIVMSLMGVFSYQLVKRQIVQSVRQTIQAEAQNVARTLEYFFQQRLKDLDSLSETPLISDYNKNQGFGLAQEADVYRHELEQYFRNFSDRSKVYYDIAYINPKGRRVCTLQPGVKEEEFLASLPEDHMTNLRRGNLMDLPFQNAAPGGPLVKRYAKPVFDSSGAFLGAVVTDCDLNVVDSLLRVVRIGKSGGAYLEDINGENVLNAPKREFSNELRSESPLKEKDGRWRWKVVVHVFASEFLDEPLRVIFYLTIILSVLASLFLLVIIVGRVSKLMKPIESMVQGTERLASGDLTYRFADLNSEELSKLGAAFNQMAETLELRNRELENRLRQLTALRNMEESVIQRQEEETILRACLEAVARGFGFDRTGFYWINHVEKEIVGRCLYGSESAGFSETNFRKRRIRLGGDDILNQVIRGREAMVVKNPTQDNRVELSFVAESKTREFVLAPVCGKDRVLGILNADNYFTGRPLTEADRDGLMLFANAVGLALENASLFQNLAESETRLRTVLENSPEGVIGLSREHRIGTWNRGAEKIFGRKTEEMLGQPLSILFDPANGPEFNKLMNIVIENGAVSDFVMPGRTKDGRPLCLSVSWGGAHTDFWMNKEWTLIVRDITESRRLQQQLIRSEKLSAVGQLISGIAHELNNPLQAVVGYSDILTDDLKEKMEAANGGSASVEASHIVDDLKVITDNAMRCQKIIENLLLFVRQGEIEKKPVALPKILQATRELLQYKLKKAASIQVIDEIPPDLPLVKGNFQQIQQVFVNLINNACDALGPQESEKKITVNARSEGDRVVVSIADTGPGVPDSARERLFEPFFTTKPEGRGTGLGLAVCKQIVEEHGGKISFTAFAGKGTTFVFDFPLASPEKIEQDHIHKPLPMVRNKRVLIVDDEPDVRGFLIKVVQAEGNFVETAGSIKEAIEQAGNMVFDLVVTDIRLGEGDGMALFENWVILSNKPRPTFAFMTGDVINAALARDFENRGLPLLHKPIDLSTFQRALRTLLAKPN